MRKIANEIITFLFLLQLLYNSTVLATFRYVPFFTDSDVICIRNNIDSCYLLLHSLPRQAIVISFFLVILLLSWLVLDCVFPLATTMTAPSHFFAII